MSFKVNWPKFSPDFLCKAREQLAKALNKGDKPANIVDHIDVVELNMGTKPPDLEILEIGELGEERFRGIFRMIYSGDAYVVLHAKVQANPLNVPKYEYTINKRRSGMLAANKPLVVPMQLRISNLLLRGIIVLVVDKQKGITLVFKNDPLEKVDVNSTFDNVASVRRFLQNQIEGQLRKMFQDDLPQLIHNLSLEFIQKKDSGDSGVSEEGSQQERSLPELLSDDVVNTFVDRPHHAKWNGNEPVVSQDTIEADDAQHLTGSVLHRSLGPKNPPTYGLQRLFDPESGPQHRHSVLSRVLLWSRHYSKHSIPPRSTPEPDATRETVENGVSRISSESASDRVTQHSIPNSPTVALVSSPIHQFATEATVNSSLSKQLAPPVMAKTESNGSSANLSDYGLPIRPYLPSSRPSVNLISNAALLHRSPSFINSDVDDSVSVYTAQSSPNPISQRQRFNLTSSNSGPRLFSPAASPIMMARSESNYRHNHRQHANFSERDPQQRVAVEITDRVVLQPTDNQVAAHLATLMQAHHTMAPLTHHLEHATFRTLPHQQTIYSSGWTHGLHTGPSSIAGYSETISPPGTPRGAPNSLNPSDNAFTPLGLPSRALSQSPPLLSAPWSPSSVGSSFASGGPMYVPLSALATLTSSGSSTSLSSMATPPLSAVPAHSAVSASEASGLPSVAGAVSPSLGHAGPAPTSSALAPTSSPQTSQLPHRRARTGTRTVHTIKLPSGVIGSVAGGLSMLTSSSSSSSSPGSPQSKRRPASASAAIPAAAGTVDSGSMSTSSSAAASAPTGGGEGDSSPSLASSASVVAGSALPLRVSSTVPPPSPSAAGTGSATAAVGNVSPSSATPSTSSPRVIRVSTVGSTLTTASNATTLVAGGSDSLEMLAPLGLGIGVGTGSGGNNRVGGVSAGAIAAVARGSDMTYSSAAAAAAAVRRSSRTSANVMLDREKVIPAVATASGMGSSNL